MTDSPSAEALSKELLAWMACDHEPWRIPEIVKRLNAFAAQAVAASRQPSDMLSDLVARFSTALLEKLRASEEKYGWENGWSEAGWEADCQQDLLKHLVKGDPRDVAAYCAFLWHHGWKTVGLDTASERAKPDAGVLRKFAEDIASRNPLICGPCGGLLLQPKDCPHHKNGARPCCVPSTENLADDIFVALVEARRAEREKCAQYVREAADGADTFSDDALYRIAAAMRALAPSPEGRST